MAKPSPPNFIMTELRVQRYVIKFCVKLGRIATATLSELQLHLPSRIQSSGKRFTNTKSCAQKSAAKAEVVTFYDYCGIIYTHWYCHSINAQYYVTVLKQLMKCDV